MNEYEKEKKEIAKHVWSFISTSNLMELSQALFIIKELLDKEEFPIQQYQEWLKK